MIPVTFKNLYLHGFLFTLQPHISHLPIDTKITHNGFVIRLITKGHFIKGKNTISSHSTIYMGLNIRIATIVKNIKEVVWDKWVMRDDLPHFYKTSSVVQNKNSRYLQKSQCGSACWTRVESKRCSSDGKKKQEETKAKETPRHSHRKVKTAFIVTAYLHSKPLKSIPERRCDW